MKMYLPDTKNESALEIDIFMPNNKISVLFY